MIRFHLLAGAVAPCLLASPVGVQARDNASAGQAEATILVKGQLDPLRLDDDAQASSRLELTIRETPASVEMLMQSDLQLRGLRTARETFNDVVGGYRRQRAGQPGGG